MKHFIATIILLFSITGLFAQQDILSKVSNKYYITKGITDVDKVNTLLNTIDDEYFEKRYNKLMDKSIDKISNNLSYHEVLYSVSVPLEGQSLRSSWGTSVRYFGLLTINWANQSVPAKSIETLTHYHIDDIFVEDKKEDIVIEYIKNSDLEASYIYNKLDNMISFIILSKTKSEKLRGNIIINLPVEERSKFMKDFIESTKFDNGEETRIYLMKPPRVMGAALQELAEEEQEVVDKKVKYN